MLNKVCLILLHGFFQTYFIPDTLRQLERVNFQMRSETRIGIHIKCSIQILIVSVMHEYIWLKLTIINLYENLRSTLRVFYSREVGVKNTEKLIRKSVLRRHKKLTHQRVICRNSCFYLCFAWFWNIIFILRDNLDVIKQNSMENYA
jgi:hypothetical protein